MEDCYESPREMGGTTKHSRLRRRQTERQVIGGSKGSKDDYGERNMRRLVSYSGGRGNDEARSGPRERSDTGCMSCMSGGCWGNGG